MITLLHRSFLDRHVHQTRACLFLLLALPSLSGCHQATNAFYYPSTLSIEGRVTGGAQAIANSSIQLYAVGSSGIASQAEPLLREPIQSDGQGQFIISDFRHCSAPDKNIYIAAQGGSAVHPNGADNDAIALVAMLGPCDYLSSSTFAPVNELTTVASIASMSPDMTSLLRAGSPPRDSFFSRACSQVNQLVDMRRGISLGPASSGGNSLSSAKLNSLPNIVAACSLSSGGVAGEGSVCSNFFNLPAVANEPQPANTAAALLEIAKHFPVSCLISRSSGRLL